MDDSLASLLEYLVDEQAGDHPRPVSVEALKKTAAALRAAQEREREYREALEKIKLLHFGDSTFHDDAVSAHLIARAVLEKHKGEG